VNEPKITLSCEACNNSSTFPLRDANRERRAQHYLMSHAHGSYPVPEVCNVEGCTLCRDKRPAEAAEGERVVTGDAVDHPPHYNAHPACEAIELCEELSFNLGNAVKYLWRAGQKGDRRQDLEKAIWYLEREKGRNSQSIKDGELVGERIEDQRERRSLDSYSTHITACIPGHVKKLARVIAKHKETPPVLAFVLLSLADDNQAFDVAIEHVKSVLAEEPLL
jgi:hypothetical protein